MAEQIITYSSTLQPGERTYIAVVDASDTTARSAVLDVPVGDSEIALQGLWALVRLDADWAGRVRLYSTADGRDRDRWRTAGDTPAQGVALLYDFVATAENLADAERPVLLAPQPSGAQIFVNADMACTINIIGFGLEG
jgi:hypothetical protein